MLVVSKVIVARLGGDGQSVSCLERHKTNFRIVRHDLIPFGCFDIFLRQSMNDYFHIEQHLESVKYDPHTKHNTASDQSEPNQFFKI